MKLSLSVFGSTTSTVEAPRGAQYSRLSGPAQIPLFSLPCFLPLRPPVPEPVNGGRRCRACGAFRRPPLAVRRACLRRRAPLRESLPSYSAKPGAFYAPRALRWTTPPRGRTDPFQGPKIKPMFHRCSMLFQDDFGVENGGQNEVKILPKSCLGAFQDALGAGLPGDAVF